MRSKAKWEETRIALEDGADEIDMVMNIGAFKSQDYQLVFDDIARLKEVCGSKKLKVILETGLLTNQEIMQAALLAKAAKADFLKTSTGFVPIGATVDTVKRLRSIAGDSMGVKASGGVRTTEQAKQMIAAGANRLGCSASIAIIGKGQITGTY
jgi:deoxyribose-phosphate aldolase